MASSKQYLTLESAKAYVAGVAALITTVATSLLAIYGPETPLGHALTVAVAVAGSLTAFLATYKVPNAEAPAEVEADGAMGDEDWA